MNAVSPIVADSRSRPVSLYDHINSIAMTGDQLNRAWSLDLGVTQSERDAVLAEFADAEGLTPIAIGVKAIAMRRGIVCDLLDGPGIDEGDWMATLEAAARVRIIDDEDALPIGHSGVCFDYAQFEDLRQFMRELPW